MLSPFSAPTSGASPLPREIKGPVLNALPAAVSQSTSDRKNRPAEATAGQGGAKKKALAPPLWGRARASLVGELLGLASLRSAWLVRAQVHYALLRKTRKKGKAPAGLARLGVTRLGLVNLSRVTWSR